MPAMSCAELLTTVRSESRKINFLLLGKGARWKCFVKAEAMAKLGALDPEESALHVVTGLAHGVGNKLNFLVDGDHDVAREHMKAAWRAEKLKWDDNQVKVLGESETPPPAADAPPARPTRAAPDAAVELAAVRRDVDHASRTYPFAAARLHAWQDEIAALLDTKPGLAAIRVRELRAYTDKGVKSEHLRRQMRSFATDLASARNRAAPEVQARLDTLKSGFDAQLDNDPDKASQYLDALRKQADGLNARSGKEMGEVLKVLLPRVNKLVTQAPTRAAELTAARTALMSTMKTFDQPGQPALATRQLRELQMLVATLEPRTEPAQVQRILGRHLFLARDESGRTMLPGVAIAEAEFIAAVADEICQTEDDTRALYQAFVKKLGSDTDALLPPGFAKPMKAANTLNPLLGDETRPRLTAVEAKALQDYSSAVTTQNSALINTPLRNGQKPAPPHDKTYARLRDAFARTRPMATAVEVTRDYEFDTPEKVESFLAQFRAALGSGQPVRIKTFLSTGAAGRPKTFKGNVVLFILACRGLDMSPYTEVPQEKELLLDYMTPLKVLSIVARGEEHHVRVEQLPD